MKSSERPSRPVVRYHGGKWKIADWIVSHLPPHRVYVEPFGGAASVLMKKPRAFAEVYNDLDSEMVNLFRTVRDRGEELAEKLRLTPFAREEFDLAWTPCEDPLERARRTVVRAAMGRDSASATTSVKSTFRAYVGPGRPAPTMSDFANYPDTLAKMTSRLRGVAIERLPAEKVMSAYDSADAVHYVDPPYLPSTRDSGKDYRHELGFSEHAGLLAFLKTLKGRVVLSGYRNPLYSETLVGWNEISRKTFADGAHERVETLWISPELR